MTNYGDPNYGTGSRSPAEFAALQARNAAALAAREAGADLATDALMAEHPGDLLIDFLAPLDPESEEVHVVEVLDEAGADRLARIVAQARRKLAKDEALYELERVPIDEWIAQRRALLAAVEARCLPRLFAWHASKRTKDSRGKTVDGTITLPSLAKLVSTGGRLGTEVDDRDAFVTWARTLPAEVQEVVLRHRPAEVIEESWEPDKAGIKKAFRSAADDGEPGPFVMGEGPEATVVPGVHADPGKPKFDLVTPEADG